MPTSVVRQEEQAPAGRLYQFTRDQKSQTSTELECPTFYDLDLFRLSSDPRDSLKIRSNSYENKKEGLSYLGQMKMSQYIDNLQVLE